MCRENPNYALNLLVLLEKNKDTLTLKDRNDFFNIYIELTRYYVSYGLDLETIKQNCLVFHLSAYDPTGLLNLWKMHKSRKLIEDLAEILVPQEHQQEFLDEWITYIDENEYKAALRKLMEKEKKCLGTQSTFETSQGTYTMELLRHLDVKHDVGSGQGIDMEQLMLMDEYANEKIRQKMGGRLANISTNRIQQEIANVKIDPLERHLVGSSYEGFPVSAWSDEDTMLCCIMFPIVLWTSSPKKGRNFVMAEQDPNKRVYLRLKVVDKRYLDEDFRNIIDNNGYLKTNDFIEVNSIRGIYPYLDTQMRQGPSIASTIKSEFLDIGTTNTDNVHCLKCQSWPPFTSDFFNRGRLNNWPSQKLLDKVKGLECHVVPVGYPGSESYNIEWRLSFSIAERELVYEMYEPYANCMFALKLIKKKYIIFRDSDKPTPFCSYFTKTACLWMCETFPHIDYSLMDLIRKVLDWLIDCYQHKHLPHYFVPQHNLIGHLSMECCENVRETLTEVKTDLWTKVLLSLDTDEHFEWCSRDNTVQELGAKNRSFVERVNNMRLMNDPGTTEVITDALRDLHSKSSSDHNFLMEKCAGFDNYIDCGDSQEAILFAFTFPEKSILPIIEQVEDLVPKGYGEMFKTCLYRYLGDAYTHLLVPLRNRGYDELLDKYRHRSLHYYGLGAKMVFPDNYSDHGIGGQILVVQYNYVMGNYKELKKMCESILSTVEETKNYKTTRLASIVLCIEKPLGVNAWAVDEIMYHLVKCTQISCLYLHPIALVLYIKARVLLTEGDTENALNVVIQMKEYLDEACNPIYPKTIKMFITIIESLVGLLVVMKFIIQNKNSL